jgi:hypothetical protein
MEQKKGNMSLKSELLRKVGDIAQIASLRQYEIKDSRADGLKAYSVSTGSGLDFTVFAGKCMDIYDMKYKGKSISFLSKAGISSSQFYSLHLSEFYRTFQGGMLYTCGLANIGMPCTDNGMDYPEHGRISHVPAENCSVKCDWINDEYIMEISGEMRDAGLFYENLVLKRTISTKMKAKYLRIHDEVENRGFEDQMLAILYHINFGYPLLDEGSRIVIPQKKVTPRDEEAIKGLNSYDRVSAPVDGFKEQVYFIDMACDSEGYTYAGLINDNLGLGAYIKYNITQLPKFLEWKSMRSGDYSVGLEPGNTSIYGRIAEREKGNAKWIAPLEKKHFDLEIGVLEGKEDINKFEDKVEDIRRSC